MSDANIPVTAVRLGVALAPDGELLTLFAASRHEAAFAELVRRHGPVVLAACRRVLGPGADADDAFQAAFLVLARKAVAVRDGRNVGAWLYGTARHAALRLRDKERRRRFHECRAATAQRRVQLQGCDEGAVDDELDRLPDRYRAPLVACLIQGRPQPAAAADLGWTLATLRRRLARGRELLRVRLARRGLAPAAVLATAAVSAAVAGETARLAAAVAAGTSDAPAGALALEVLHMTGRNKWRTMVAAVAVVVAAAAGGGTAWQLSAAQVSPTASQPTKAAPPAAGKPADRPAETVAAGDRLTIRTTGVPESAPVSGVYTVEPSGKVSLGPYYGRVSVGGATLEEAEALVRAHLEKTLKAVSVAITRAGSDDGMEDRVRRLEEQVKTLRTEVDALRRK